LVFPAGRGRLCGCFCSRASTNNPRGVM